MSLRKNKQAAQSYRAAEALHAASLRPTRHLDGSCAASAPRQSARGSFKSSRFRAHLHLCLHRNKPRVASHSTAGRPLDCRSRLTEGSRAARRRELRRRNAGGRNPAGRRHHHSRARRPAAPAPTPRVAARVLRMRRRRLPSKGCCLLPPLGGSSQPLAVAPTHV